MIVIYYYLAGCFVVFAVMSIAEGFYGEASPSKNYGWFLNKVRKLGSLSYNLDGVTTMLSIFWFIAIPVIIMFLIGVVINNWFSNFGQWLHTKVDKEGDNK